MRLHDIDDLVGTAEIARACGVHPTTVVSWRRRYDNFPAPLAVLGMGHLFSMIEVKAWRKRMTQRSS